jgi:hypothetical protein
VIIKLTPEQISKSWDFIRYGIVSVPSPIADPSPAGIRSILSHLLMGTVQCWAMFEKDELSGGERITGFVLTTIAEDFISGGKFLNIYDLFFISAPGKDVFEQGLQSVVDFAKANGCNKVTAYSTVTGIIDVATKLGFKPDCRFLIKEVQ